MIFITVSRLSNGEKKKKSLFNKWCWANQISTYTRIKLRPYIIPYANNNTKSIKDLNMKVQTIKLFVKRIQKF